MCSECNMFPRDVEDLALFVFQVHLRQNQNDLLRRIHFQLFKSKYNETRRCTVCTGRTNGNNRNWNVKIQPVLIYAPKILVIQF